jgi:hypothetical protein
MPPALTVGSNRWSSATKCRAAVRFGRLR